MVTAERMCSGLLFGNKLLDCGFGVLANLRRASIPLDQIEELYVSHTHADHIGDFTAFVWAMQLEERAKPLKIVCSESTARTLRRLLRIQSTPRGFVKFELKFETPGTARVRALRTNHSQENLAFFVEHDGRTLVYSGDTAYFEPLAAFGRQADILVHESTFLTGQTELAEQTSHSTAEQAAQIAAKAGVQKLALTHLSPLNEGKNATCAEEARQLYVGTIIFASDLLRVSL